MTKLLWAAAAAVVLAPSGWGAGTKISVSLTAPVSGTVVPYYGASPVFQWRFAFANPHQRGNIWLEVSSTKSFAQEALQIFPCGYDPGPCRTSFQWPNRLPYWYDLGDSCADLPAIGVCHGLTNVFYWRVRFEPEGTAQKISSAIGTIRRAAPVDIKQPSSSAESGSGAYGVPDRFFYVASDNSGVVRPEFQLYDGNTVVYGARNDWDRSGITGERYVNLILPASVKPGLYRWCLTLYDYSGNRATSCAPYTITGAA